MPEGEFLEWSWYFMANNLQTVRDVQKQSTEHLKKVEFGFSTKLNFSIGGQLCTHKTYITQASQKHLETAETGHWSVSIKPRTSYWFVKSVSIWDASRYLLSALPLLADETHIHFLDRQCVLCSYKTLRGNCGQAIDWWRYFSPLCTQWSNLISTSIDQTYVGLSAGSVSFS